MSWWARKSLRTKIFLAFSSLILAVLLATLGFTQFVVSREAKRTLNRELLTTGQVFDDLMRERAARLTSNSVLLASDFALKRVMATHFDRATYDAETLASAALSYQRRIGVEHTANQRTDELPQGHVRTPRPSVTMSPASSSPSSSSASRSGCRAPRVSTMPALRVAAYDARTSSQVAATPINARRTFSISTSVGREARPRALGVQFR